ncbi:MAG: GMC oxidoreductase [Bradymonadia bacterium]
MNGEQAGVSADAHVPVEHKENIVIGSGFGGAVTALRLTEALLDVCLLERGRRYEKGDFPRPFQRDNEGLRQKFRLDRMLWQIDHGLLDSRMLGDMSTLVGAGYGGGSLIYANVHMRPPADLFKTDAWKPTGLNPTVLAPYFDRVERILDVQPAPEDLPTEGGGRRTIDKTDVFLSAVKGRTAFKPNLAVRFGEPTASNDFNRSQGTCVGCGGCNFGCQYHAKNTLDLNYLAAAEDSGHLEVRTLAEVHRIEQVDPKNRPEDAHLDARARYLVVYVDHLAGGEMRTLSAQRVFICAGAVGSTELLLRSQRAQAGRLPHRQLTGLSDRLGHNFAGNADALGLVVQTEKAADPNFGPVITATTVYDGRVHSRTPQEYLPKKAPDAFEDYLSPEALERHQAGKPAGEPPNLGEAQPGDPIEPVWSLLQDGGFLQGYGAFFELLAQAWWVEEGKEVSIWQEGVSERLGRRFEHLKAWTESVVRRRPRPESPRGPIRLGALTDFAGGPAGPDLGFELSDHLKQFPAQVRDQIVRLFVAQVLSHTGIEDLLPLGFARSALTRQLSPAALSQWAADLAHFCLDPEQDRADRAVFLAMGRDLALGRLWLHPENPSSPPAKGAWRATPRLQLTTDLNHNRVVYHTQERLMRDTAEAMGGQLRVNPMWSTLRTPITVHAQGGCVMAASPKDGVVDLNGQVHGHEDLYVLDGAIFPGPVGVNPSHTIAAIAEHHIEHIIRGIGTAQRPEAPLGSKPLSTTRPDPAKSRPEDWTIPKPYPLLSPEASTGVKYPDVLTGFIAQGGSGFDHTKPMTPTRLAKFNPDPFRIGEQEGQGESDFTHRLTLNLTLEIPDIDLFIDPRPRISASKINERVALQGIANGHVELLSCKTTEGTQTALQSKVEGTFLMRALDPVDPPPKRTSLPLSLIPEPTGGRRTMEYTLRWTFPKGAHPDFAGRSVILRGLKTLYSTPGLDLISDFSTLYASLEEVPPRGQKTIPSPAKGPWRGIFRVHLIDFLDQAVSHFEVTGHVKKDPQQALAAMTRFGRLVFGELWDVYGPSVARQRLPEA